MKWSPLERPQPGKSTKTLPASTLSKLVKVSSGRMLGNKAQRLAHPAQTEAMGNSKELYLGPGSFNPAASTDMHDEEGLRIDVHMNHGKMMILRDGEHISFDRHTTSPTQSLAH